MNIHQPESLPHFFVFNFFSSDDNIVQSHTKHCEIVPSASLDDSLLDQDEETITNAQEVSVEENVNSLESQSEIVVANGVIGIDTIPSSQEVADIPKIVRKIGKNSRGRTGERKWRVS